MKEGYSAVYVLNIIFQSIFTLLWNIGTAVLVGWVFVRFVGAPEWVYVPLILLGVGTGIVSMMRFILSAMKSLERIEEQRRRKKKAEEKKNGK